MVVPRRDGSSATGVEAGAGGPGRMLKASLGRRGAEADFPLSREQLSGTAAGTAEEQFIETGRRDSPEPYQCDRGPGSDKWEARRCPPGRMLFSSVQQ